MNADDLAKLLGGVKNITINIHNGKGDIRSGVEIHTSSGHQEQKRYRCSCGYESNNVFDFGQYGCLSCSQKRLHEERLKLDEQRDRLFLMAGSEKGEDDRPISSTVIIPEPLDGGDRKRPYYDPKGLLSKP